MSIHAPSKQPHRPTPSRSRPVHASPLSGEAALNQAGRVGRHAGMPDEQAHRQQHSPRPQRRRRRRIHSHFDTGGGDQQGPCDRSSDEGNAPPSAQTIRTRSWSGSHRPPLVSGYDWSLRSSLSACLRSSRRVATHILEGQGVRTQRHIRMVGHVDGAADRLHVHLIRGEVRPEPAIDDLVGASVSSTDDVNERARPRLHGTTHTDHTRDKVPAACSRPRLGWMDRFADTDLRAQHRDDERGLRRVQDLHVRHPIRGGSHVHPHGSPRGRPAVLHVRQQVEQPVDRHAGRRGCHSIGDTERLSSSACWLCGRVRAEASGMRPTPRRGSSARHGHAATVGCAHGQALLRAASPATASDHQQGPLIGRSERGQRHVSAMDSVSLGQADLG